MYRSIMFIRFSLPDRIEHWILAVNFLLLAITGLSQMYYHTLLSEWIIQSFGGIEIIRTVHHICAFIFILEILFHIGAAHYKAYIRKNPFTITPVARDFKAVIQALKYNFGISPDKSSESRYSFSEKSIFWGLTWGSLIMVLTGFFMLNPIATTRLLPGVIIPMAKVAHGAEAVLAVLAMLVWHFYFFLMKRLNAIITASSSSPDTAGSGHPLESIDLKNGLPLNPVDRSLIAKWWHTFLPQYLFICGIFLACTLYFVNFEGTSILTVIPSDNATIYTPVETSTPYENRPTEPVLPLTSQPELASVTFTYTWKTCLSNLFLTNCVRCHENTVDVGINLRDYDSVMNSGLISPGAPDESSILAILSDDNHADRITDRVAAIVHDWILSGAPREHNLTPEQIRQFSTMTWSSDIKAILEAKCTECHGASAFHDLDLRTYYSTMDSGVIRLSSPDESPILIKIGAGGHPGQFSNSEFTAVHEWILYGAPSGMTLENAAREFRETELASSMEFDVVEPVEPELETVLIATWENDIKAIFEPTCTGCHGSNAMGGVDLSTYEATMDSGSITAGDPDNSSLIILMESGSHPVLLSDQDIITVRSWIEDGALLDSSGDIVSTSQADARETMDMAQAWDDNIATIFETGCLPCHGSNALGGLDLSTFETTMESGSIIPGDPDSSSLVTKMESGSHPALLSEQDIIVVRAWINGDVLPVTTSEPESTSEIDTTSEPEAEDTMDMAQAWDDNIAAIFEASCLTCHGSNAVGGLDLSTFEAAMDSGSIIPGDPDNSSLIVLMESGNHPALLDDDALQIIIEWIRSGT